VSRITNQSCLKCATRAGIKSAREDWASLAASLIDATEPNGPCLYPRRVSRAWMRAARLNRFGDQNLAEAGETDVMRRRRFIAGLVIAGLDGAVGMPMVATAQTTLGGKIQRVGVLWHAGSAEEEREYMTVLMDAFRDLGYVDGKNVEFLHRFPAEQPGRFRVFAEELVQSKVDLVIAVTPIATIEVKKASTTVPIVFVIMPDPVGFRVVESLARPGGNATGLSLMAFDTTGKRLGMLRELVPSLSRIALLFDTGDPSMSGGIAAYLAAAKRDGIEVQPIGVATPADIEPAFASIARDGFGAVSVGGGLLVNERAQVGASALAHKLPTMALIAEMVPYGVLLSYGPDFLDYFRKAAVYADKILKGARPADLPVEQPTRFKLVVNLKAAKAIGLTVPNSLLVTADEVVE
jgi:putative tryptophan/tyrosine transport system substrate-binding protein